MNPNTIMDLRCLYTKIHRIKSGERGGQFTGESLHLPICLFGYYWFKWFIIFNAKCSGAPSCINQTSLQICKGRSSNKFDIELAQNIKIFKNLRNSKHVLTPDFVVKSSRSVNISTLNIKLA